MTKIVTTDVVLRTIPAPRSPDQAELELQAIIEEERAQAQHHLLDINLQVFGSVTAAATIIVRRARRSSTGTSVFTCNVDHVMLMNHDERFREAYQRADVVTIDGAPLALLSKWTGTANARRVTGVDLTEALVARAAQDGLRVALIGGAPGRGAQAATNLRHRFPELPDMFVDSPRMGFQLGDEEDARLVRALKDYRADVVIVCLGAPKQELWIDRHRAELAGAALVGAGATIDFLSGHQPRAPRVFQATGTEAVYRLATDFRRLWRRYLMRDTRFLMLFAAILLTHVAGRVSTRQTSRSHNVPLHPNRAGDRPVCRACGPERSDAA